MSAGSLYATRAVTLEYQRHAGGGFEAARRELTERLLRNMNGGGPGYYSLRIPEGGFEFTARVQREGPLLVVTQLARA